ncbi:hypothetical protein M9458_000243, partial [Cirrhinus mrigala]
RGAVTGLLERGAMAGVHELAAAGVCELATAGVRERTAGSGLRIREELWRTG